MFDKIAKLSMKSLSETNSGKLVSLISSDLFSCERGLSFSCMIIASPIVNIISYIIIGTQFSWEYAGIVFGVWLFTITCQSLTGALNNKAKGKESGYTDLRLQYVTDMVVGVRTIKCYGWENHYIEKLKKTRAA